MAQKSETVNITNYVPMLGFLGCSCCQLKHKENRREMILYWIAETRKTAEFQLVLCFSDLELLFLFIPLK